LIVPVRRLTNRSRIKNSTKDIAGKKTFFASADETVPAVGQKLHLSHCADFRDLF
jgi:hypothetical protein